MNITEMQKDEVIMSTLGEHTSNKYIEQKLTEWKEYCTRVSSWEVTDNILTKTQAMIQLLDAGIEPSIAIASVGLWNDAYSVYEESKPYLEKWSVDNVRDNGQDIEETQIADME